MRGVAEVTFAVRDGTTRLCHLYQTSPLRVLFPEPGVDEPPLAALVTTSGGVVGGDRLSSALAVGPGASAQFVAQAAEKIYRSAGPDAVIDVALDVGAGGWLDYLPQETILFEGARLRRRTVCDVAAGAGLLAGEMLVFGRRARGEAMTAGLVREAWDIRREGRLIWADALHLDGDVGVRLADPAGFAAAVAQATVVLVSDDAMRHLDGVRARLEGRAAASVVNGLLLVRWLADDALAMRRNFAAVWTYLRQAAGGLAPVLPRLWHV